MTSFASISKNVGWEERAVRVPSVEKAQELLGRVKNGDMGALQTVLSINRFAPSPTNDDEVAAITLICEALVEGRKHAQ